MVTVNESRFLKDNKFPRRRLTLTIELDALDYNACTLHDEMSAALADALHGIEMTLIERPA